MKTLLILISATAAFAATPAETAIEKARAEITKHPDHAPYYNVLAMAYARRARETSDVQYYAKAEGTLQRSFTLAPDNYEGLKTLAWLQLGRHEFAKALETATKLNEKVPDDVLIYGYLADANTELGRWCQPVAQSFNQKAQAFTKGPHPAHLWSGLPSSSRSPPPFQRCSTKPL